VDETRATLQDVLPRWLLGVRQPLARAAVAIGVAGGCAAALAATSDVDGLRLSPVLVLGIVLVAGTCGSAAAACAAVPVVAAYWYWGVPRVRSFGWDGWRTGVPLAAMVLLSVGIVVLTRTIERALDDVKELDQQRQLRERAETERRVQAEAYAAERDRIARTLSTTLVPPNLPAIPGYTAAGWILPASADEVAGDFYDLFRPDGLGWVAVLGDVSGKGAEAAAVTSLARYAARVTALDGSAPAAIADRVGAALDLDSSDLFCTMAVVRGEPSSGALVVALAGHPQVRILGPHGVRRAGRFGPLLGLGPRPHHEEDEALAPGESVVLFSDGLIERSADFGEDALDAMLGQVAVDHAGEVAGVLAGAIQHAILAVPAERADDLALLVVTRSAGSPASPA
jgi:sigma-B regulation protein RsbU (phosphoserine phosphatase)